MNQQHKSGERRKEIVRGERERERENREAGLQGDQNDMKNIYQRNRDLEEKAQDES